MYMQQSKADISQKPASTLPRAPLGKQLAIQFSPDVAFAVTCKPAETKPADQYRQGSRSSMNGTCRLAASVRHSTSEGPITAGAPGRA
jgi:hypothetical protein